MSEMLLKLKASIVHKKDMEKRAMDLLSAMQRELDSTGKLNFRNYRETVVTTSNQ